MSLIFDQIVGKYKSSSQIARVLTEKWVQDHAFCPACNAYHLQPSAPNTPAIDFHCVICSECFQLKSSKSKFGSRVVDGSYDSLMAAVRSSYVPNLLLLQYDIDCGVISFDAIPRAYLVPDVIERRPALKPDARRAGWVGCNIMLSKMPSIARVPIIQDRAWRPRTEVLASFSFAKLLQAESVGSRSWLLSISRVLDRLDIEFSLTDMYAHLPELQKQYPHNHNIKPKIRQQLQFMRNAGIITFLGDGFYRKTAHSAGEPIQPK